MLLALLVTVALIAPTFGSTVVPGGASALVSANSKLHAGETGPATLARHGVDHGQPPSTTAAGDLGNEVASPCTDGVCALCSALTASPALSLAETPPGTWTAQRPMARAGRQIAPDSPPPIA